MPLPFLARAALAAGLASIAASIDNGLAQRPGLGWNSDYCINCQAADGTPVASSSQLRGFENEAFFKHIADFLVSSGLAALGYTYVNSDSLWDLPTRDANGDLQPDPARWPSGITATSEYLHDRGLGFGVYGDRGTLDCNRNPGSLGHETQDAAFYARYEVDWFKSDSCYASPDPATAFAEYGVMRDALNASGRHIWFALCGWSSIYAPVGQSLGNSWRIGPDTGSGWLAVLENVEAMLSLASFAGPSAGGGGWNDMSLLLLPGMGASSPAQLMTPERHRSQFNMHCIFAANMLVRPRCARGEAGPASAATAPAPLASHGRQQQCLWLARRGASAPAFARTPHLAPPLLNLSRALSCPRFLLPR